MATSRWKIAAVATAMVVATPLTADILTTPGADARILQLRNQPQRGMTKHEVESRFGDPDSRRGPVGNPPIFRWDYRGYSVFFEGNLVLHTVVSRAQVGSTE